ncbi:MULTISPECIES: PepSY-associated TM helix domain-containing protein [Cycloclasticus]|jgi:hypothetical protein|uniref:PepSY-associated TM helix family protein n=1 Tax=Cycloclasticus zancles 78-ME TaxID=1198232 RepID=S5TIL0_9GAMM|nr:MULTISPECIES: PepSY-associated TM helix domain-containing protein [Cycloclasticus]AGS40732.1 PepSY-associated TM helix family protein [Cycloclasticus zancles 78-ME]MBV1898465.1 PepSY domain-containing protein [Cycloclasticus sp.]MDF1829832.1 PepSY-associated TM helix domain-containing protein [Cycloclasticus pugetii]SHJ15839.1 PepSY-associated TM region [Cycloclasticus pugetii]
MGNKRYRRKKFSSLYLWHRYTGLLAAVFVIFISLSGIALNHTDDLALKKKHLSSNFLLDSYNIQAPTWTRQFKTKQYTVTQADDLLFINSNEAMAIDSMLAGAIEFNDFLLIALTNTVLLIDADNQLVETLGTLNGVPANINRIGSTSDQQIHLLANDQIYRLTEALSFQKTTVDEQLHWASQEPLSKTALKAINQRYKSNIISLETFMLDIHSGRFFGAYGVLLFDLIAVILIFLAFTGVIIWIRQSLKHRQRD